MFNLGKPYTHNEETDKATGECCFCGKEIEHFNDGGVGWALGALDANGRLGEYLYCCHSMCEQAKANDRSEIHRCYNPDHGLVPMQGQGWKLDPTKQHNAMDYSHYIEFLGDRCPECGGLVAEVDARLYDPEWAEFFEGHK